MGLEVYFFSWFLAMIWISGINKTNLWHPGIVPKSNEINIFATISNYIKTCNVMPCSSSAFKKQCSKNLFTC